MRHELTASLVLALSATLPAVAQQRATFDYWHADREMIQAGVQAVLMCNGLFTSHRTLQQVFDQELAYLRRPVGSARGGEYRVDWDRKAVSVGVPGGTPVMRAACRAGLGRVALAPARTSLRAPGAPSSPAAEIRRSCSR